MDNVQRAWLAALIDGEGSIAVVRQKAKSPTAHDRFRLSLSIGNTNEDFIEAARQICGSGSIHVRPITGKMTKIFYLLHIADIQAAAVLKEVRPYLIVKGKIADVGMELATTRMKRGRAKFVQSIWDRQQNLWLLARELNGRGPRNRKNP